MKAWVMGWGRAILVALAVCTLWSSNSGAAPRPAAAFQAAGTIPGLAAYWPLDTSSSGTTPDLSGNNNTGTLTGGATIDTVVFAPVPAGNIGSLKTAAAGDFVTVPSSTSLQITSSLTLAAWINTTATGPNQQGIIEKWDGAGANGYFLRLNASDYLSFTIFSAASSSGITTAPRAIATGGWHHVAGVYDSTAGSLVMYVDGTADATTLGSGSVAPGAGTADLHIGDDYGANNFLGNIDEARVYGKALTNLEIATLVSGVQPPPTGLTATPGPGQITLSWTAPASGPTTVTYNIYRRITGGGAFVLIANTAATSYTDLAVSNPTSYDYQVTAVAALESAPAGPVTAIPLSTAPPGPRVAGHTTNNLAHRCGCSSIETPGIAALALLALAALATLLRRK